MSLGIYNGHSDRLRETPQPLLHTYYFRLGASVRLYAPSRRQDNAYHKLYQYCVIAQRIH